MLQIFAKDNYITYDSESLEFRRTSRRGDREHRKRSAAFRSSSSSRPDWSAALCVTGRAAPESHLASAAAGGLSGTELTNGNLTGKSVATDRPGETWERQSPKPLRRPSSSSLEAWPGRCQC